jgi:hypothetical protein
MSEPLKPMNHSPHLTRVETELSYVWGETYSRLFVDAVRAFFETYTQPDWRVRVEASRPGFLTLIATRSPDL